LVCQTREEVVAGRKKYSQVELVQPSFGRKTVGRGAIGQKSPSHTNATNGWSRELGCSLFGRGLPQITPPKERRRVGHYQTNGRIPQETSGPLSGGPTSTRQRYSSTGGHDT
jgi:hypothetical protein